MKTFRGRPPKKKLAVADDVDGAVAGAAGLAGRRNEAAARAAGEAASSRADEAVAADVETLSAGEAVAGAAEASAVEPVIKRAKGSSSSSQEGASPAAQRVVLGDAAKDYTVAQPLDPTWQLGSVHRFWGSYPDLNQRLPEATLASLRSFSPFYVQCIWSYGTLIFPRQGRDIENIRFCDAARIRPWHWYEQQRKRGLPEQHVKDLLSFAIVHKYGGWFADFDVLWCRRVLPPLTTKLLLASEPAKRSGQMRLPDSRLLSQADLRGGSCDSERSCESDSLRGESCVSDSSDNVPGALNIGIFGATAGCELLQRIGEMCEEAWGGVKDSTLARWAESDDVKAYRDLWQKNQLVLLKLLKDLRGESCGEVVQIFAPISFYPLPRWLRKWPPSGPLYGCDVPGPEDIAAQSFCVNCHVGFWPSELTAQVVEWVARAAGNVTGRMKEAAKRSLERTAIANALWDLFPYFAELLGDHALAHRLLAPVFDGLAGRGMWSDMLAKMHNFSTEAVVATILWDRLASRSDEEERYPAFPFPKVRQRDAELMILQLTGASETAVHEVEAAVGM